MERSGVGAERTTDINIRVGMKSPPAEGTGGDAEITDNQLCGIFPGPGQLGTTSTVTCDGEYICIFVKRDIHLTHEFIFLLQTQFLAAL